MARFMDAGLLFKLKQRAGDRILVKTHPFAHRDRRGRMINAVCDKSMVLVI